MAALLVFPVCMVSAESAPQGGTAYEIPLSELNKVKKKSPSKQPTSEPRKKRRNTSRHQESSPEAAAADASKSASPSTAAFRTADPLQDVTIHHSPYSFVVPGRRTVIHAVISSRNEIKEVNCTVRSDEGGESAPLKMEIMNGSRFTYRAPLPGLKAEALSLRYTITVIDTEGKATRSQEFVSPMSSSPVVPSWQMESTGEERAAKEENEKKNLKSDVEAAAPAPTAAQAPAVAVPAMVVPTPAPAAK